MSEIISIKNVTKEIKGNTAQRLCGRNAVRFFVRLHRNFAGILSYVKEFLCDMTEKSARRKCPWGTSL